MHYFGDKEIQCEFNKRYREKQFFEIMKADRLPFVVCNFKEEESSLVRMFKLLQHLWEAIPKITLASAAMIYTASPESLSSFVSHNSLIHRVFINDTKQLKNYKRIPDLAWFRAVSHTQGVHCTARRVSLVLRAHVYLHALFWFYGVIEPLFHLLTQRCSTLR